MYAKLVNGTLRRAPNKITYNNRTVFNPTEKTLEDLGYYPVIYADMPRDAEEGTYYSSYWEESEETIIQRWKLEIYVEPEFTPTETERIEVLEQAMLELAEVMADG